MEYSTEREAVEVFFYCSALALLFFSSIFTVCAGCGTAVGKTLLKMAEKSD